MHVENKNPVFREALHGARSSLAFLTSFAYRSKRTLLYIVEHDLPCKNMRWTRENV